MNRLIFEGRFLVNMSGSLLRQDALRPLRGRLNWERMFRTADYHRVANLIYLGLLGNREKVPLRWRDHFFERYQEALRFGEVCEDGEKEILTLFDMRSVSCVVLGSSSLRNLYQMPEAAANNSLRLFFDTDSYYLAKGYLVDLGYETDVIYSGCGEHMRRVSGFSVEIYYRLPFELKSYEKTARRLLERASYIEEYEHIRVLSVDDSFLLMAAELAYHYVEDAVTIREMMDFYLCHQFWREKMHGEYINNRLKELRIGNLVYKLLYTSYMWFGSKETTGFESPADELTEYDIMENRILSRGVLNQETDSQAIMLAKLIEMEREREKYAIKFERYTKVIREHWKSFRRKLLWAFPEYKYMCALYPVLEKVPIVLPFCWLARGIRFLRR